MMMTTATTKTTTALVPSTGVNAELVEKAVSALLKYHEHQTNKASEERGTLSLLGADRPVHVQINLDRIPSKHEHKPRRILIPHPLYKVHSKEGEEESKTAEGVDEPSVCLIVKEGSKPWVKEMVARFHKHMGCVQKVLGLDSMRKKHSRYEQRRELLHKYDVFMVDDRILPMVGKALGRDFYKYKRLPIPIKLTRKEALPFAVQNALKATFFTISQGDCLTVRAGNTGMHLKSLVENVVAICETTVPKIPHKWSNIRAIAIKTPDSTSLPIYNKTPEELLEIARLAGLAKDMTYQKGDDVEHGDDDDGVVDKDAADGKEKDEKKKRKIAAKSPLVRAVKRQLEDAKEKKEPTPTKKHKKGTEDAEQTPSESKDANVKKSNKQSSTKQDESKEDTKVSKEDSKPRKSPKSKRDADEVTKDAEEVTPKSKKSKSDKSTPSSTTRDSQTPKTAEKEKSNKRDTDDSNKSKKKSETPTTSESVASRVVSTPKQSSNKASFIPSPKFAGSKSGYVFKSGVSGVGYYVDVKPVVDPMVIEALTRKSPASGGRHKSNNKANRNPGKRKSRHSR